MTQDGNRTGGQTPPDLASKIIKKKVQELVSPPPPHSLPNPTLPPPLGCVVLGGEGPGGKIAVYSGVDPPPLSSIPTTHHLQQFTGVRACG